MRFSIKADNVSLSGTRTGNVDLEFEAEAEDVLDEIAVDAIIRHLGVATLLDEIGIEEAKSHFNLTEETE